MHSSCDTNLFIKSNQFLNQEVALYGNDNKQYICEIVDDLCNNDRSIYILDAGAGTGNVGKVVSTI